MTSKVRAATAQDVAFFYANDMPKVSIRAVVVEANGEPVVIGGVSHSHGAYVAFMNMKPGAEHYAVGIMKAVRLAVANIFIKYRTPIYAYRDFNLKSSGRFLERVGFVPLTEDGEIYVWQPQSH
jgi:hypothetical protein